MQAIPRRSFFTGAVRYTAIFLALGSSIFGLAGCISLSALINIIVSALASLQTLLGSLIPPAAAVILTAVKAGLADLSAAIAQYDAAPASEKTTLLAKIDLLLTDIVSNFQLFINQVLPGAGTLVTVIEGIVELILSTIAGIRGDFPQSSTLSAMSIRMSRGTVAIVPVRRDAKRFKKSFNTLVANAGYPQAEITH